MSKMLQVRVDQDMIHTYTQHGFLHAIVSAEDKVCHEETTEVADIRIEDYELYTWDSKTDELWFKEVKDNHLLFFANKWNHGMNMVFWRECQENDQISVNIYKQLFSNAWSNISVFVANEMPRETSLLHTDYVVTGYFSKDGVFYSNESGWHNRTNIKTEMPVTVTLIKDGDKFSYEYVDLDNHKQKTEISAKWEANDKCYIGFCVNLGNSIYYDWMFSNYIQLCGCWNGIIPIDFIVNWHKDWCVHTSNHLIDYNKINQSDLKRMGCSLLEFIKLQIDLDYYVEIENNDNITLNFSDERHGKFFHQNLIYGYSDEKQLIYILYYDRGYVSQATMSYEDFESERNRNDARKLYMLKYNPCYEKYELSPKRLLYVFSDYQKNENISYYDSFYDNQLIGCACYKQYCDLELLKKVSWDVRRVHLLYERNKCNLKRIEYMCYLGYLSQEDADEMFSTLKKECDKLIVARNLFLKKRICGKFSGEKVQQNIREAYACDEMFTQQIITCLSKIVDEQS